ncbi:uncharacterized protein LOC128844737 isoform X3 [Malaclemys terrapin pileata]|uniref:uncharacterized protein LOC128844737 isoform X3 n=1 Tax=Malaclemys terrapin pileata TaxID=2991368 RepID=UPI0023A7BC58|nr:uncharacterized protein LOC128844737 isoform X3 [Malaclemys terrapin pileata]
MASAMGARHLVATVVLMCILLHEASAQNLIKNPKNQKTEHSLLINEINADNPGEDTSEFVELYHTSGREAPLDDYYLVFYNGNGNQAYKVLNLQGKVTNNQGFFLVGSSTVKPQPSVILPKNTIQNGPDAIALYYGKRNYQEGMRVTSDGLVDALVHKSRKSDRADMLLNVLTPNRDAFLEDPSFRTTDESIERCHGEGSEWIFQVAMPTPGKDNHCIPSSQLNASAVLISEVHAVTSPGESEFIELQGPPSTVLSDLVLVLIEGRTKRVYFFMDVYGKTSPEGLFLIGPAQARTPVDLPFPPNSSSPLLSTGPQAIALYVGNSSSYTLGKAACATNLLDALVYTSNGSADPELLEILTPGRHAYENNSHQPGNMSMSRCSCCSVTRDPSIYALSSPTPGQFNDCPSSRFSQPISLCLHIADCQLWLLGSYEIQTALAQALDKLCNCGMSVAYFKDPVTTCRGTELVFTILLTAKSAEQLSSLVQAFTSFLESPRAANFSSWNATVEKACSKDANVTASPPGASSEGTREPPSHAAELLINEVTTITPFGENACANSSAPSPTVPSLLINELSLANSTAPYQFIELKGKPGATLGGYTLVFFSGQDGKAYASIPLQGTFGATGLFVIAPSGPPRPDQQLPFVKNAPSVRRGSSAVAVYNSRQARIPVDMMVTLENLVDALVYTWESSTGRGQLNHLGPSHFVPCAEERPVSLSRCSCCDVSAALVYAISDPTPGLENSCPLKSFAVDLDMCLLTPNCSMWTPNSERAHDSLEKVLTKSIEENCACGISQFYLHAELNFTCTDSMLQLSGQVWAKSPEQQHLILNWHRDFAASPHPFSVDGRVLKTNKECVTPDNAVSASQNGSSFQAWEIALFVLGSILLTLTLVAVAVSYFKRHSLNYTTIEMNDRRQMAADF